MYHTSKTFIPTWIHQVTHRWFLLFFGFFLKFQPRHKYDKKYERRYISPFHDLWWEHFILSTVIDGSLESRGLTLYVDVLRTKTDVSPHQSQDINTFIHLEVTLPFVNPSCLILEFVIFWTFKKTQKKHKLCEPAARKPWGCFCSLDSHATHVAAGPREAEGVLPCRSGYQEQPRANH